MGNDDFMDFSDLEEDVTNDGKFNPAISRGTSDYAKTERYPCTACNGTGEYRGVRRHQEKSHCFACKGKGYFLTSPAEREKARQSRNKRAWQKQQERVAEADRRREAFCEANPGLYAFLKDAARWSDFAGSLANDITHKGGLTDNQLRAALSMQAKSAARAAEREKTKMSIDLALIREKFEAAVSTGYKKPVYRAEGLVISRAPDHGRNPGCLYVKDEDGTYLGKIEGVAYKGKDAALTALKVIAEDPLAAAINYGRKTGRCACCGRELTNEESVAAGIGPVCRGRWNL